MQYAYSVRRVYTRCRHQSNKLMPAKLICDKFIVQWNVLVDEQVGQAIQPLLAHHGTQVVLNVLQ